VIRNAANETGLLTLMLAGEVHVTGRGALTFDLAQVAEQQWSAKGEGTVHYTPVGVERLLLKPLNPIWADVRVRQALMMGIDRQQLIDTFFNGKVLMGHSLLHPSEAGYEAAERAITKYPYDLRRAQALLQEAGWRPGADGVMTDPSGKPLEISYRTTLNEEFELREQLAISAFWKEIGVRTIADNLPGSVRVSREEAALYPGVTPTKSSTTLNGLFQRWHSNFTPRAETGWTGDNAAQWTDPTKDRLLEQIELAMNPREMEPLLVQLATLYSAQLPTLPLYYMPEVTTIHRSLANARPRPNSAGTTMAWAIYEWEWRD
jgi:peptide/nickel transport system substrate-binding protein